MPPSCINKPAHSGLETERCHQEFKTGVSVVPKRTCVQQLKSVLPIILSIYMKIVIRGKILTLLHGLVQHDQGHAIKILVKFTYFS